MNMPSFSGNSVIVTVSSAPDCPILDRPGLAVLEDVIAGSSSPNPPSAPSPFDSPLANSEPQPPRAGDGAGRLASSPFSEFVVNVLVVLASLFSITTGLDMVV
jgi:hypothetical protein